MVFAVAMFSFHQPVEGSLKNSAVRRLGGMLCGFTKANADLVNQVEPSSGWVRMLISLSGSLRLHSPRLDVSIADRPAALILRAGDGPICTHQDGVVECLEIIVPPYAARKLFGRAIDEGVVDWNDLAPALASPFLERLYATTDWGERFALADAAMEQAIRDSPYTSRREVLHAWQRMADAKGAVSIRELAKEIGWSERHFSDRFRSDTGLLPKMAARQMRFDHAHHQVVHSATSLAGIAAKCGYADQSHMTRDFAELADATPAGVRKAQRPASPEIAPDGLAFGAN